MAKATLRGSIAAIASAAALVAVPAVATAATTPYPDHDDINWYGADPYVTVDGNNKIFRAAGRDRIDTAIQLMCHATDHEWDGVIIARADDFADALTSGPLADVTNYALLVSNSGAIDGRVVQAIRNDCNRNVRTQNPDFPTSIDNVVLIGGTGVWSEGVRAGLQGATGVPVHRVAGIDRYDTAVAIARAVALYTCLGDDFAWWVDTPEGLPPSFHTCKWNINSYVATGADFPDALAAGAAAAANDGIVLLTNDKEMDRRGKTEAFLDGQLAWMPTWSGNHIEIHSVGGQADAALRGADIRVDFKHVGKNRYATAVELADTYAQDEQSYTLVSGENYPDGVVGGAFAANHDGPLLLTRDAFLSPETKEFLRMRSDLHARVMVVGGIGSVSRDVSAQVWDALHY